MHSVVVVQVLKNLINLSDKLVVGSQVVQKPLRNQNTSVVVTLLGPFSNSVTNAVHDVLKSFLPRVALLRHDDHVGAGLHGALQSQVRRLLAHQTNEVPVLDCRSTVGQHVADQLRVDLRSRVETDRGLDVTMVDVTVDGAWNADDASVNLLLDKVLRQVDAIGESAGRTNQDEASKTELLTDLSSLLALFGSSELVRTSADVVNTTEVQMIFECFARHLNVIFLHETVDTVDEADQLHGLLGGLVSEETINNVICTRGLSAHEAETNLLLGSSVNVQKTFVELR